MQDPFIFAFVKAVLALARRFVGAIVVIIVVLIGILVAAFTSSSVQAPNSGATVTR